LFCLDTFGQACVSKCTKLVLSNRVIHKVEKEKVPILGLGKKDNKHKKAQQKFLQCKKKTKANSKLPFN